MKKFNVSFVLTAAFAVLCFVLPQASAAELKPVLTLKIASLETIADAGTKIAELAGYKEQWNDTLAAIESLEGVNTKNPFWIVLRSDGNEIKSPILYLPIDDFDKLNLPAAEALKSDLKDDGKGNLLLNSPFGLFAAVKKKGAYVITLQEYVKDLPDDPNTFIAGLEKYIFAAKVEFENTSPRSIENALAPVLMIAAMQSPESADSLEQIVKTVKQASEKFASVSFGLTFNSNSADLGFYEQIVPRKGSDTAKYLKEASEYNTTFSGFAFNDKETVFAMNSAGVIDEDTLKTLENNLKIFSDTTLAQLEENEDADEETLKIAKDYLELIRETCAAVLTEGVFNTAAALSSDGIFIAAATVKDTGKVDKFFKESFAVLGKEIAKKNTKGFDKGFADKIDEFVKKYGKKDVKTTADFKISSLVIPLNELDDNGDMPKVLKNKTLAAYWAVKENTAIAVAAGFNEQNTEKALNDALEATKNPSAIKNPQVLFALGPFGKLLKNYGAADVNDKANLIVNAFADAGSNAKITVSNEYKNDTVDVNMEINGKTVAVLVKLIKVLQQTDSDEKSGAGKTLDRKSIKDF